MMRVIKWLWEETKQDLYTIQRMLQGKAKLRFPPSELFKDFGQTLNQSKLWFLIIIIAVLSGLFVGGKYYQNQCNEFIMAEYHPGILACNYPKIAAKYGLGPDNCTFGDDLGIQLNPSFPGS